MGNPLVSVIIPVYNGERFLAEAIESVLAQTYRPVEVIVVDDGSTDGSAKIAAKFKDNVHYVYQPNSGPAAARNRGLKMVHGGIIGFIDADDLWTEDKLQVQLPHLAGDPSVEIVLGHIKRMWAAEGTRDYNQFTEPELALSLESCLFRKTVFDKVGYFDPTLCRCEDWDWFMRARELGVSIVTHEEVTAYYRRHEHNLTLQKELGDKYFAIVLKKSLERRRQQNNGVAASLPKISDFGKELGEKPDNRAKSKKEN